MSAMDGQRNTTLRPPSLRSILRNAHADPTTTPLPTPQTSPRPPTRTRTRPPATRANHASPRRLSLRFQDDDSDLASPPPSPTIPPPPPPTPTRGVPLHSVRFAPFPVTISARREARALRALKPNGLLRLHIQPSSLVHVVAERAEQPAQHNLWPAPGEGEWLDDPTTVRALYERSAVNSDTWHWSLRETRPRERMLAMQDPDRWHDDDVEHDERTRRGRSMPSEVQVYERQQRSRRRRRRTGRQERS
ncbi:hypothetical protein C8Q76DRAFT_858405 [Earliella scabrosa]|nr:hypothetical protein C8Q76DRAFT_858405 [Earliella scabrosa]